MTINQLWPDKTANHQLQACQTIATLLLSDDSIFTGIYDSSNGHWLEMTYDGVGREVGYLGDLRLGNRNLTIKMITVWNQ